ncbi:sigma-70 family RNA polymerase sigma factor [Limibacter armeniacum]|uniref:sigma-70 family RNA polymerase sigma factor n=1 Tax=Limibacter armeniacum TaxID=466084 RepID=UPI002FE63405
MHNQDILIKYQPLLYAIANKMVGVGMDAEDVVQETMVKLLKVDFSKIEDIKNYLARAITNNCLNYLESLKRKKEVSLQNVKAQLPATIQHIEQNLSKFDMANELSVGMRRLLSRLTPSERGVYLLKEVFNYDYTEITEIFEKKKDHCRQLVKRAKDKMQEGKERFKVDPEHFQDLYSKFQDASLKGNMNSLIEYLQNEVGNKNSD